MKTLIRLGWIIPALAFFAACSGDEGVQTNLAGNQAVMTGLTIETYARTNIVIPNMPQPIDAFNWDDDAALLAASVEGVSLQTDADAVLARFRPVVSFGAHAVWGIGSRDARPFGFTDIRVPATFENGDYVYFKVTSEDGFTTNYYRFSARVKSPVIELAEVYIGRYETHTTTNDQGTTVTVVDVDERMKATIPDGLGSNNLEEAVVKSTTGILSIMTSQSRQAEIKAEPQDRRSTVKFALAENSSSQDQITEADFQESNVFDLSDYNILFIEVTAENGIDKAYYRFRIEVGRIATIKTLTFVGNNNAKYDIANTGTPRSSWGSVASGNFKTADMPAAGFGVEIELDDPASTASYQLIDNKNAANPNASAPFTSPNKVIFDGTKVLALKIISENRQATRYYKIEVELLAAAFEKQPKSDYYYYYNADTWVGNGTVEGPDKINWYTYARLTVDPAHANFTAKGVSQVVPLSVELDRTGSFTYQWYEANSWYGGYGFDADGRILYYPTGNPVAVAETGFTGGDANNPSTYYVNGFDEKKNVSFHNGGNQFYRLPTKGRTIPGATGTFTGKVVPSYTPSITYRPFMDGFTSETHYYWVEITDSQGRKAVSKRAAIVSERDPTKKHHIVDMNEDLYLGPKANPTETGTARNPKVFKVKRETYKIPVTFPAGFNVNDYTVATVQALFFLIDGTPWIQNWTQGDIGFEADDGSQLIYYNLTNNNGTLGLVGGGKEPGGGSLTKTPKYLIVKPAGEKPTTEKPPFEADGVTPKPNNDAQGWFCGFIELVEVRFEGPAR